MPELATLGAVIKDAYEAEPQAFTDSKDEALAVLGAVVLHVATYGAVADGDGIGGGTNNLVAFQAAIDAAAAAGGGIVQASPGIYAFAGSTGLTIPSGVILRGVRWATVLDITGITAAQFIAMAGTAGSEIAFAAEAVRGDTSLDLVSDPDVDTGDICYIKSQRAANHADATDEWQLSADNQAMYFAEFVTVSSVAANTITTVAPIIFPTYAEDDSAETSPDARAAATLQKIAFVERAGVADVTISKTGSDDALFIRADWCKGCRIERVRFEKGTASGNSIYWVNCLDCEAVDCSSYHSPAAVFTDPVIFSSYKVIGSTQCGFTRCFDENGAQSFDISFFTNGGPSIDAFVRSCRTWNNRTNPCTWHPGGYGGTVADCDFLGCASAGVTIRSRKVSANNNTITAAREAVGGEIYGLAVAAGWARDCRFIGNVIEGFPRGIQVRDETGGSTEQFFEYIGLICQGNSIKQTEFGFDIARSGANITAVECGLRIEGNTFSYCTTTFINLDAYTVGAVIRGNTFYGPLTTGSSGAVDLPSNCVGAVVENNRFIDIGATRYGVQASAIGDTTTFPVGTYPTAEHVVRNNTMVGANAGEIDDTTPGGSPLALGLGIGFKIRRFYRIRGIATATATSLGLTPNGIILSAAIRVSSAIPGLDSADHHIQLGISGTTNKYVDAANGSAATSIAVNTKGHYVYDPTKGLEAAALVLTITGGADNTPTAGGAVEVDLTYLVFDDLPNV